MKVDYNGKNTHPSLRVAMIDNMNNNYFAMGRYLRDKGMDVHLFIIPDSSEHFHPSCDTFENVNEMKWIHYFPYRTYGRDWLYTFFSRKLHIFHAYDVIIASGYSLAFLKREGIQTDIFVAYGGDIFQYPFRTFYRHQKLLSLIKLSTSITKYQQAAIKGAKIVVTHLKFEPCRRAVEKLGLERISTGIPIFYNKEKLGINNRLWSFLEKHDFVIFNHSRQSWKSNPFNLEDFELYGGDKRNDKLIQAFKLFLDITNFKKPVLVLFEYGDDVLDSKKLVSALGIEDYVVWMPKLPRKFIMQGLQYADIGFNSARKNLSCVGGTSYELFAAGVPVMSHTNGSISDPDDYYYQAPFVEVLTVDDIFKILLDYESNPEKYRRIGKESLTWFNKYLGEGFADKYYGLIHDIVQKKITARVR